MTKNRSKLDKMPVLELVLKNAWTNDAKPCLWILKNSGFAFDGVAFFKVSSIFKKLGKLLQKLSQNDPKIT